jgi:hypothetical protein
MMKIGSAIPPRSPSSVGTVKKPFVGFGLGREAQGCGRRGDFLDTSLSINHVGSTGAGEGNRTLVCSLGSCRSTIELHPRQGEF